MTVSTSTSTASYAANGSTTTFAYPFKIFTDSDLVVILRNTATSVETVQVLNSNYTVTGAGNVAGGNVVFGTAPASGNTVFIRRELPLTQETDFVPNDPFPAEAHENALDKLTMLVQQGSIDTDRAILFPQSDAGLGLTNVLPSVNDRRTKLIQFANDGSVDVIAPADLGTAIIGANYAVDTFTGSGATTIYTLSAAPGSTNNTAVYIDGVYQSKNNYSVSGSTLTFSTAPPLNSAIEIVIGDAIPAGAATTAAGVSYTQGGFGAVTRTVQSRLRDFVSVKDFGAVGDGVTDDTTAIQAAIDGGGTVFLPKGTYRTTAPINVWGRTSLVGAGEFVSVIKPDASVLEAVQIGNVALQSDAHSGSIEGLTVDKVTYDGATNNGGFVFYWAFNGTYKDIEAREFKYNFWFKPPVGKAAAYLAFINCKGTGGFYNVYWNPDTSGSPAGYANEITFYSGRMFTRAVTDTNIHWNGGSQNRFVNVSVEGAGTQAIYLGGAGNFVEMCRTEGTWSVDDIVVDAGGQRNFILQHDFFTTITDNGTGTTFITHQDGSQFSVTSGGAAPPSLTLKSAAAAASTNLRIISNRWSATDYAWFAEETATSSTAGYLTTQGQMRANRSLSIGQSAWNFSPLVLGNYYLWVDSTGDLRIKNGAPTSDTDGTIVGTQS